MAEITELDLGIFEQFEAEIKERASGPLTENVPRDYGRKRIPFMLTCRKWLGDGDRYLVLFANPSEVTFNLGLREGKQEVRSRTVLHSWPDPNRNDSITKEPILNFTFQTGNVMPLYNSDTKKKELPPGLGNAYDFLHLIREVRIWNGGTNYVYIAFNSPAFPKLTLIGFFDPEGTSIPQTADSMGNFNYSATFTVHASQPDLDDSSQLVAAFKASGILEFSPRPVGAVGDRAAGIFGQ